MMFGVALGATLAYFFDPDNGTRRRERVREWWEQNSEPMMNQATEAANKAQARVNESVSQVNEKVTELGAKMRREPERQDVPVPGH
jgi:hypothetical protein